MIYCIFMLIQGCTYHKIVVKSELSINKLPTFRATKLEKRNYFVNGIFRSLLAIS